MNEYYGDDNVDVIERAARKVATPCTNQHEFNKAFRKAIKYTWDKEKPSNGAVAIGVVVWLFFLFWAVMLASKVQVSEAEKRVHYVLAILFSPIYVIAYYCGMRKE